MSASRCRPTRAEIDLGACVHRNLEAIRQRVGAVAVWPVVKADAYGHGAARVGVAALSREKVAGFCVATASARAVTLRQAGIAQPILVMAGLAPGGEEDPVRAVCRVRPRPLACPT